MHTEKRDSMTQKALKSLCCSNGWSYGVFWRFDLPNSLLLTMEDAYCEQQMGFVIDNMLLQVHMLGNGIVGQTAFTKKQRWLHSDEIQHTFQDEPEFHCQFSSGIQTIAVISVEPQGVVQFGSTQKIPERMEFVNQTKELFRQVENGDELISSENEPSSSTSDIHGPSGLFASVISSGNSYTGNLKSIHGGRSREFCGTTCSGNLTQTSVFVADHGKMEPLTRNSIQTPCTSTWSIGNSTLTSFEQQLPSEMSVLDFHNSFPSNPNNNLLSCRSAVQISQDSTFKTSQCSTEELMNHQNSALLFHDKIRERSTSSCTLEELFQSSYLTTDFSKSCLLENISQQFVPSPEQRNDTLIDELSHAIRFTPVPSGLYGHDVLNDIPFYHPISSGQSSLTNSCIVENDPFGSLEVDHGCRLAEDTLDDLLMPVVGGGHLDFSTNTLECISETKVDSMVGPKNGLFSKLGLELILDGNSGNSISVVGSSFEDEVSSITKRRRTGSSSVSSDQVQLAGLPCFGGKMNNLDGMNDLETKREVITKLEVDPWLGDRCSMNGGGHVVSQPKKEEPVKVNKKKAKPGTRPRPKDRQQIQDRVSELRELIPNGVKMSIDSLLARTIKHMLFLQSVIKHADKLKQADEPKMKHQDDGDFLKDHSNNGVTWACEFLAQTMLCPLVVEDLSAHGQMLIEMLCEESGFFLEIVDIIRGFGLTILKGVMEVREKKIWARFIVESESSRHVTRVDIFMALVQLLEPSVTSEVNTRNQLGDNINRGTTVFNNFKQPVVPLPISMVDTLL